MARWLRPAGGSCRCAMRPPRAPGGLRRSTSPARPKPASPPPGAPRPAGVAPAAAARAGWPPEFHVTGKAEAGVTAARDAAADGAALVVAVGGDGTVRG